MYVIMSSHMNNSYIPLYVSMLEAAQERKAMFSSGKKNKCMGGLGCKVADCRREKGCSSKLSYSDG